MMSHPPSEAFRRVVNAVAQGGREHHEATLLRHAEAHKDSVKTTIRDLPTETRTEGIVVSAGPSLHRRDSLRRIHQADYQGVIIAVDASFAACLRAGIQPDYVLTLDPHPTRVVRWFGDPDWEEHAKHDDYFVRQDLDIAFRDDAARRNRETLELVNTRGRETKAIVASSAPPNVVERIRAARMSMYWWNPLVDDPRSPSSLTRRLRRLNGAPCFNTGGNVGTAAWVFAVGVLKLGRVGLVGMDFGYYADTPPEQTQLYYEYCERLLSTESIDGCFWRTTFPITGEPHYTDPTYYWYARNFAELAGQSSATTVNCTEGGVLVDGVALATLDAFLAETDNRGGAE